jgi:peptide/nickel transport system substrate-binding protein
MKETNDSLRYVLYRKADAIMMQDAPVVPLYYDVVIRLAQPNLEGFRPNGLNLLELRQTRVRALP